MPASLALRVRERAWRAERRKLDDQDTAVTVIDGVLAGVDAVRREALKLSYAEAGSHYPGVTATPAWEATALFAALRPYFDPSVDPSAGRLWCSMVTKSAAALSPAQRVPHWDGTGTSGVLYLNPPDQCHGGTAFYRHRATGLIKAPSEMSVPLYLLMRHHGYERYDDFIAWVTRPPDDASGFVRESTEDWALIELVEMRYNRLVMFDGRLFHSGFVRDGAFQNTAAQRRLTINFLVPPSEGQG